MSHPQVNEWKFVGVVRLQAPSSRENDITIYIQFIALRLCHRSLYCSFSMTSWTLHKVVFASFLILRFFLLAIGRAAKWVIRLLTLAGQNFLLEHHNLTRGRIRSDHFKVIILGSSPLSSSSSLPTQNRPCNRSYLCLLLDLKLYSDFKFHEGQIQSPSSSVKVQKIQKSLLAKKGAN